jgi:hypothetical protein
MEGVIPSFEEPAFPFLFPFVRRLYPCPLNLAGLRGVDIPVCVPYASARHPRDEPTRFVAPKISGVAPENSGSTPGICRASHALVDYLGF